LYLDKQLCSLKSPDKKIDVNGCGFENRERFPRIVSPQLVGEGCAGKKAPDGRAGRVLDRLPSTPPTDQSIRAARAVIEAARRA
jgi:hypothetical protein